MSAEIPVLKPITVRPLKLSVNCAAPTSTDLAVLERAKEILDDDREMADIVESHWDSLVPTLVSLARDYDEDTAYSLHLVLQSLATARAASNLSPLGRALGRLEHYAEPEVVEARIAEQLAEKDVKEGKE